MGVDVGKYEVVTACYVPVGRGIKYKNAGQVVTLSDEDAAALGEHVRPAADSGEESEQPKPKRKRVAKRNTQSEVVEEVVEQPVVEEVEPVAEEVVEQPVVEEVVEQPVTDEVVEQPVTDEVVEQPVTDEVVEEVTSDVGDPAPGDE